MTDPAALKARIAELESWVAEKTAYNAAEEAKLQADPKYLAISEAYLAAQKRHEVTENALAAMTKAANLRILSSEGNSPYYSPNKKDWRSGTDYSSNIREDVLAAMKVHLSLRRITSDQIAEVARGLIQGILENTPGYAAAKMLDVSADENEHRLWNERLAYERGHRDFINTRKEEDELFRLKAALENPVRAAEVDRKMRERASIPDKIPLILETLLKSGAAKSEEGVA